MSTRNIVFKRATIMLALLGVCCIVILGYFYITANAISDTALAHYRFEIVKLILVSVVIGLLGIFIPSFLAKEKHDFELKKEGRRLYSIVKTGLDYLPERLASMTYPEAMLHIQRIHQAYHLVILYPDSENPTVGNYQAYFEKHKIYKLRTILTTLLHNENYIASDALGRIQLIRDALKSI